MKTPLQFNENSFRALLSSMPQIVFISSPAGETLYLNQKWYDYTGNTPGDIESSWEKVIHPDDIPAIYSGWGIACQKEISWTQEYRLRRRDGVYRWHLGHSIPDRDKNGVIERWIGTVTDIEDQKVSEKTLLSHNENLEQIVEARTKELMQANSFLDTIIENIPNMIFVKDAQTLKFVQFNRAGEQLLGLSRHDLIGKSDKDFFPASEAAAFQEKDRAVIAGKVVVDIPEETISTTQGIRTLHTKKFPVFDSHGVPRYLIGISEDISEHKIIEEERLQLIQDQFAKNEAEKTTERFRFLSEASALLGSTLDHEVLLKNLTTLAVPSIADWCTIELIQPDRSIKQLAVAHENPEKIKWAYEMHEKFPYNPQAPSGTPHVLATGKAEMVSQVSSEMLKAAAVNAEHLKVMEDIGFRSYICAPIRSRGKIFGTIMLVTTNESNRNYTQADLHLAEDLGERAAVAIENSQLYKEARHLNRVKDEFLATLSHELRTPLNVILGHSEILNLEIATMNTYEVKVSLDAIYRNAKTQTSLIDDLLDVSSIITGKVSYKPVDVDPIDIVSNIVESFKATAFAKNIKLVLNTTSSPKKVSADPTRLHQVVWNLISNAIKFTPADGTVQILLNTNDRHWEICVKDTGRGIDPEFLPYVFDRFRQEDASTTRRYGGLGLGLSIVRHLAELHGGSVKAESAGKDLGSTFHVVLPLDALTPVTTVEKKNELALVANKTQNLISFKNLKILLIEDSEDSRFLISSILQRAGALIAEADSAEAARTRLISFTPDIIISDIGMPEENGLEFIRKLRQTEKFKLIPAIALTAYVRAEEKNAVFEAGFQSHVGKPINTKILFDEIQKLIQ